MILITGAAGFIGSSLATFFHKQLGASLLLSDDFSRVEKQKNLEHLSEVPRVDRELLLQDMDAQLEKVTFVLHIGARTDTTEFDETIFEHLNVNYSKKLWQWCTQNKVPFIYASSAATYGLGELGYKDDEQLIPQLKPLNPYGVSKNVFDQWVIEQSEQPPFWAGLKFFNVYGPNEYHKGRMASVIFHAFHQIKSTGGMRLFRSHHPDFSDGGQMRDFVYVKDVITVIAYLYEEQPQSGIYNLGSGKARTFLDLATLTSKAMGVTLNITFIDTPADIRDKYQYFTEADMQKLISTGYKKDFYTLEEGISEYVNEYLTPEKYYL